MVIFTVINRNNKRCNPSHNRAGQVLYAGKKKSGLRYFYVYRTQLLILMTACLLVLSSQLMPTITIIGDFYIARLNNIAGELTLITAVVFVVKPFFFAYILL